MLKIKYILPLILILLTVIIIGHCVEYGSDILTDGTATASSVYDDNPLYAAEKAVDDSLEAADRWLSKVNQNTGWWKYDLGVGVTKIVCKFRYYGYTANQQIKDFTIQGSNNDSDYDVLLTETAANVQSWQEWTFSNSTAYRYYKVVWTSIITANNYAGALEMEMMEEIKEEGANIMFLFSNF